MRFILLALIAASAFATFGQPQTCPPDIIEFSDNCGTPLAAGDVVTGFPCYGISVSAIRLNGNEATDAMIFDSSNPTGNDFDLGTPNEAFGGPGLGDGGAFGPGSNDMALENLLIVSEDDDNSDPDDNGRGGEIRFDFAAPVDLKSLKVVDNDAAEDSWVRCYAAGSPVDTVPLAKFGNNNVQFLDLSNCVGVNKLVVHFGGSGGVSDLDFTRDADCECSACKGGVTDLKLRYDGDVKKHVKIKKKGFGSQILFQGFLNPGQSVILSGSGNDGTLGSQLSVFLNGWWHRNIYTSCWKPIGVNSRFGDFVVLSGASKNGGRLCEASERPRRRGCRRSRCAPVVVDFSTVCDANVEAGDRVDEFSCHGMKVTSFRRDNEDESIELVDAMIFDSSYPSGGDFDLGTPNEAFGGPGIGEGGASGPGANDEALHNLLIIPENENVPDDNRKGGQIWLTYDHVVNVRSLKVVDNDAYEDTFIACYAPGHVLVDQVTLPRLGDNNAQTVDLSACDAVNAIVVNFGGSGGISHLVFDEPNCECEKCKGRITDLTLRFDGDKESDVLVKDENNNILYSGELGPGESFAVSADGGCMQDKIKIFVDGCYHKTIYTRCSKTIGVGRKIGDFQIVSGISSQGGDMCLVNRFKFSFGKHRKW